MVAHKVVATAAPLRFELHIHLVDVSGTNWTTVDALTPSRAHHQVPRGLLAVPVGARGVARIEVLLGIRSRVITIGYILTLRVMHMTPGHAYITLVSPKTYIIRRKQPVGPENIPKSPMCCET